MAFDINGNTRSVSEIAAGIDKAKADLMNNSSPDMPQAYTPHESGSNGGSMPWMSYNPPAMSQSAAPNVNMPQQVNGSMYSQVPGTNWYSTHPDNPNAPKYNADGSPVASIGYSNQQTGQNFQGYGNQDQFNQIRNMSDNPGALSNYMGNAVAHNQLIPQSSIYSPSGGNMPMSASQVAASTNSSGMNGNFQRLPFTPGSGIKAETLPYDVNSKPQYSNLSNQLNGVAYAPANVQSGQMIPNAIYPGMNNNPNAVFTTGQGNAPGTGWQGGQSQGGQTMPQSSSPYGALSPDQIKAQAAAQIASQTAEKTRIANQTKTGYQTSYDRMNASTTDARNLENFKNSQLLNPFNGYSDYAQGEIARQRGTTDRQNQQDLQTKLGNVDTQLQDYLNSTTAEQQKMINDMTDKERSYFLQTNAQALQSQQMAQTQSNADRTFNYNSGRDTKNDAITANNTAYQHGRDQITDTRNATNDAATNTGYFNPSGMNSAQINQEVAKNSAAYANASSEQKQQLHERNVYLNGLLGKTDSTGSGDYTGGNPNGNVGYRTTAGQTLDYQHARDQIADERYKQKFDQDTQHWGLDFALKQAYEAGQLKISQQNANNSATSTANSNSNAQARLSWDKDPNNPANRLKESTITKNNTPKPTTLDKNQAIGKLTSDIDKMTPENRKKFFADQKSNIIAEHDIAVYNQLHSMYFNKFGDPK